MAGLGPPTVVVYDSALKPDSCVIGGGRKERGNQAVAPLDVLCRDTLSPLARQGQASKARRQQQDTTRRQRVPPDRRAAPVLRQKPAAANC
jgi:hypothetical protein